MIWAGHVAPMGGGGGAYGVLVGKPEGKRILGKRRRRWYNNKKMDLKLVGRAGTGLIWLRVWTSCRLL